MIEIIEGDCLMETRSYANGQFNLIYIDPPFNTGKKQTSKGMSYEDSFDDFLDFIIPRFGQAYRLLAPNGSFFLHIDHRESHYCKVALDRIFGRDSFMNEIIWHWDYGGRSRKKWSSKHDTIFWYAKDPKNYTYNYDEIDRIPYMAPGLVGKEKAERGKTPTDTWFITIEPTQSKKRTGYPTQKPYKLLERIIKVHSNKGDKVLDFFAGSGTTGEAALRNGRDCVLIDNNPVAIEIIKKRLGK